MQNDGLAPTTRTPGCGLRTRPTVPVSVLRLERGWLAPVSVLRLELTGPASSVPVKSRTSKENNI